MGTFKDGLARPKLGHDTAGAPHVDGPVVAAFAQEQLGRPVPESDHAVGVLHLLGVVLLLL